MALTNNDIALYKFLRKVIEFKHMLGNWGRKDYRGIPFDPWINKWAKDVFTKRGLYQYVNLFTDRGVFDKVYSGLIFRPELKFLSTPELLKADEEQSLGDEFHDQIKKELEETAPDTKSQVYPQGEEAVAAKTPGPQVEKKPQVIIIPTKEEGEQKPQQQEVPQQQQPSEQQVPPQTGMQLPQMPQLPSMPQFSAPSPFKPSSTLRRAGAKLGSNTKMLMKKGLGGAVGNIGKIGRVGLAGLDSIVGIGNQMSAGRGSFMRGAQKKVGWALAGAIFLIFLTGIIIPTISEEQQQKAVAAPISNLNSCLFTRSDQNPQAASFKSERLLGYFQEASASSSVPAQVLAAIARIESPSSVNKTDADLPILSSLSGCPRSPTGALGIMQLQPPGTRGHVPEAINKGASYLGKTVDQLTESDYCDVRSNIIIAAGFILKKLQLGYGLGDGNRWDPSWTNSRDVIYKLAETYYGCLQYGNPDPTKCGGPYNYGADLLTSIQSCQAVTAVASCPVPNGRTTTHSYEYASTHPGTRGHCDASYLRTCKCGSNGRRAKAIDVPNHGQDVILPTIDGRPVNWKFKFAYLVDAADGGGNGFIFEASAATDGTPLDTVRTLDMLHMASTGLNTDLSYPSNTAVGKTFGGHVHFTLGKNITNNTSPGLETAEADCHPGWIPSDFMCQ